MGEINKDRKVPSRMNCQDQMMVVKEVELSLADQFYAFATMLNRPTGGLIRHCRQWRC